MHPHLLLSALCLFFMKLLFLMIFFQISSKQKWLPSKIDGQILSRIPVLVGQSNYSIWHVKIRNTLSAYRVWEIVEGTNTYATTIAADQEKWKLLDRRVPGLVASTLDDSLINHVNYTWEPPVGTAAPTFPSVAKP